MDFGLAWLRRRQHTHSRVVLALFCAAWLQAAIVPCVMAHSQAAPPPGVAVAHSGQAAIGDHDHAAMLAQHGGGEAAQPCPYCPPDTAGGEACDGRGDCVYPHDPQVDARAAGAMLLAMPVASVAPLPRIERIAQRAEHAAAGLVPRISLSVSYCRFIE